MSCGWLSLFYIFCCQIYLFPWSHCRQIIQRWFVEQELYWHKLLLLDDLQFLSVSLSLSLSLYVKTILISVTCLAPSVVWKTLQTIQPCCWYRSNQGGIFWFSLGARLPLLLPWNLQDPTKFLLQFTCFWHKFYMKIFLYFLSNAGILPVTTQ